jgi:hypothetical protein
MNLNYEVQRSRLEAEKYMNVHLRQCWDVFTTIRRLKFFRKKLPHRSIMGCLLKIVLTNKFTSHPEIGLIHNRKLINECN